MESNIPGRDEPVFKNGPSKICGSQPLKNSLSQM